MRFEKEVSIYAPESILKRFQAAETSIEVTQGKIGALISESELVELTNSKATMYSKLASAVLEIDALQLNFSDLTTKYNTVTGQYSALDSKVAQYKLGVDGLSADIATVRKDIQDKYSTTAEVSAKISAEVGKVSLELSNVKTTLQHDYSTTTAMQAAIKASVDGLSSTVSSTYATKTQLGSAKSEAISSANANTENLLKSYSTTTAMNSAISQKANEINATVSSTYAKQTDLATANGKISTLESWRSQAELKITDSAIVSTVTKSSEWNGKASKTEIGTLIQQNASAVKIAWNGISNYVQFENGALSLYNGSVSTSQKRAVFNESGNHFYRDGYYVGKIGTNNLSTNSAYKGLVFDLEYQGKFMSWAYCRNSSDTVYTQILVFYPSANIAGNPYAGIHLGHDLYANGKTISLDSKGRTWTKPYTSGAGIQTKDEFAIVNTSGSIIGRFTQDHVTIPKLYANIAGTVSDERLKTNIVTSEVDALSVISKMKFREYDWIESGEHESLGLIAQELERIAPDLVSENESIKNINPMRILWYCAKAIQQLYQIAGKERASYLLSTAQESSQSQSMTLDEKKAWLKAVREKNELKDIEPVEMTIPIN